MVQRTLSAKNLTNAQGGALFASALKVLPLFFMIVPGMFARILFPEEIACIPGEHCEAVCNDSAGCSNLGKGYARKMLTNNSRLINYES